MHADTVMPLVGIRNALLPALALWAGIFWLAGVL